MTEHSEDVSHAEPSARGGARPVEALPAGADGLSAPEPLAVAGGREASLCEGVWVSRGDGFPNDVVGS